MQTVMTSRRREDFFKREDFKREFLNLGFVSRLQGVNCEPLKLGARYDIYKPFFKKVPPEGILPSSRRFYDLRKTSLCSMSDLVIALNFKIFLFRSQISPPVSLPVLEMGEGLGVCVPSKDSVVHLKLNCTWLVELSYRAAFSHGLEGE